MVNPHETSLIDALGYLGTGIILVVNWANNNQIATFAVSILTGIFLLWKSINEATAFFERRRQKKQQKVE